MKKICLNCREFKERYAKGLCKKCYDKKWHLEHPGYKKRQIICESCGELRKLCANMMCIKCYSKKRRKENPLESRMKNKKYRENNKEKTRIRNKKWRHENPEKQKAGSRKWRLENKEKARIANKKWRQNNPDKIREYYHKRRVNGGIKKGTIGRVVNENILKYGSITCEKCKKQCLNSRDYHIDHITSISKGGSNDYDNLQILCEYCNCSKSIKTMDYRRDLKDSQMFLKILRG